MNTQFASDGFTTSLETDRQKGFTTLKLHRTRLSESVVVAEVIFWDASGLFFAKAVEEVPLQIMETLIAEAKAAIPVK